MHTQLSRDTIHCLMLVLLLDICKNIEKIAEFVPQEKQVILTSRRMFPFIGNMFNRLVGIK